MGVTSVGLYVYFRKEQERMNHAIEKEKSTTIGEAKIGGPFNLISHYGEIVTEQDFKGKYLLLYFGFTHCPDICPDELDKMTVALELLDKNKATKDMVVPLFVTVDPARDTVKAMKEYVKDFHPKLIGLTGSTDQILSIAKKYRVYFSASTFGVGREGSDYLVDHSAFLYLMGKDGAFLDLYGGDKSAEEVAKGISSHIEAQNKIK